VKDGWGLGVGLDLVLDDADKTRVEFHLSLDKDNKPIFKSQIAREPLGRGTKVTEQVQFSNPSVAGRLRLVRDGSQVHCLVAPEGTTQFRLLASFAVGEAAVSMVAFQSKCSDNVGRSDVTLEKLTIREKP